MQCYFCGLEGKNFDIIDISVPKLDPGHEVPLCQDCIDCYNNRPKGTSWLTMSPKRRDLDESC